MEQINQLCTYIYSNNLAFRQAIAGGIIIQQLPVSQSTSQEKKQLKEYNIKQY